MLVALLGMLTETRKAQSWKAAYPMLGTPLGTVTEEVKEEQPLQKAYGMAPTSLGMVNDVSFKQPQKT
jgi:hypothetical protein